MRRLGVDTGAPQGLPVPPAATPSPRAFLAEHGTALRDVDDLRSLFLPFDAKTARLGHGMFSTVYRAVPNQSDLCRKLLAPPLPFGTGSGSTSTSATSTPRREDEVPANSGSSVSGKSPVSGGAVVFPVNTSTTSISSSLCGHHHGGSAGSICSAPSSASRLTPTNAASQTGPRSSPPTTPTVGNHSLGVWHHHHHHHHHDHTPHECGGSGGGLLPAGIALKVVPKSLIFDGRSARQVAREIDVLRRLRHPRVPRLFGAFQTKDSVCIAMGIAPGVTLTRLLEASKASGVGLPEKAVASIVQQLVAALRYVHRCGMVHRDVKLDNVMVHVSPTAPAAAGTSAAVRASSTRRSNNATTVSAATYRGQPTSVPDNKARVEDAAASHGVPSSSTTAAATTGGPPPDVPTPETAAETLALLYTPGAICNVTLVDFGFARWVPPAPSDAPAAAAANNNTESEGCSAPHALRVPYTPCGSRHFLPPEVLECMVRGSNGLAAAHDMQQFDAFAVGVVAYALLSLCYPWSGETDARLLDQMRTHGVKMRSSGWSSVSDEGKDFVKSLLRWKATERLSLQEAPQHAWFARFTSVPPPPPSPDAVNHRSNPTASYPED